MKVAILKYNAGNVRSVLYALQRLGVDANVTDNFDELRNADKVIFPGVGNAASAMDYLKKKKLDKLIISLKQPVLGICLGLQLLCKHSEEGDTNCLGILDIKVKKFITDDASSFKIPHVGWNNIYDLSSPVFSGIIQNSFVYYVHSYYAELSTQTIATTNYVQPYSAALQKDNFYGVQFHSEKSADIGSRIISNFLKLT